MKILENLVRNLSGATENEWLHFQSHLSTRKVRASEIIFEQNKNFDQICFVLEGLAYSYYTTTEMEMAVKKFAWEGRILSPYSTLVSGIQTCYFSAKALEDSTLVCLKYDDLKKLFDQSPVWQKLGRRFVEISLVEREKREFETLCKTASERYESFLMDHKSVLERIPQYLIASYLGLNTATISRMKK